MATQTVMAASPSPSVSPSAATTSGTTQKLRDRIEKIVDEKRDQIAGAVDELTAKRHGYIGEIQRITAEAITVKTTKGVRIVSINDGVALTKANKTVPVDQVAVGDWAVIIGSMRDDELKPERIIVSSQSLRPKTQVVSLGSITELTATSLTLASRSNGQETTFVLPKTVVYQDISGTPIKANQLSSDMQAFVVGQRPDDSTINALVVRVLVNNPTPTTPTPSPKTKPTASPKASPKL